MLLLALLLICAGVIVSIPDDSQEAYSYDYVQNWEEDEDYDNFEDNSVSETKVEGFHRYEQVRCSNEVEDEVEKNYKETLCGQWVDVFIPLNEGREYKYSPTAVKVKKCGGVCKNKGRVCKANGTELVWKPVNRIHLNGHVTDCAYAVVEQDAGCMCVCNNSEDQCSSKQKFNETTCACECVDMKTDRAKCLNEGKKWLNDDCKCVCADEKKKTRGCASRWKWNDDECKCQKSYRVWGRRSPGDSESDVRQENEDDLWE